MAINDTTWLKTHELGPGDKITSTFRYKICPGVVEASLLFVPFPKWGIPLVWQLGAETVAAKPTTWGAIKQLFR